MKMEAIKHLSFPLDLVPELQGLDERIESLLRSCVVDATVEILEFSALYSIRHGKCLLTEEDIQLGVLHYIRSRTHTRTRNVEKLCEDPDGSDAGSDWEPEARTQENAKNSKHSEPIDAGQLPQTHLESDITADNNAATTGISSTYQEVTVEPEQSTQNAVGEERLHADGIEESSEHDSSEYDSSDDSSGYDSDTDSNDSEDSDEDGDVYGEGEEMAEGQQQPELQVGGTNDTVEDENHDADGDADGDDDGDADVDDHISEHNVALHAGTGEAAADVLVTVHAAEIPTQDNPSSAPGPEPVVNVADAQGIPAADEDTHMEEEELLDAQVDDSASEEAPTAPPSLHDEVEEDDGMWLEVSEQLELDTPPEWVPLLSSPEVTAALWEELVAQHDWHSWFFRDVLEQIKPRLAPSLVALQAGENFDPQLTVDSAVVLMPLLGFVFWQAVLASRGDARSLFAEHVWSGRWAFVDVVSSLPQYQKYQPYRREGQQCMLVSEEQQGACHSAAEVGGTLGERTGMEGQEGQMGDGDGADAGSEERGEHCGAGCAEQRDKAVKCDTGSSSSTSVVVLGVRAGCSGGPYQLAGGVRRGQQRAREQAVNAVLSEPFLCNMIADYLV